MSGRPSPFFALKAGISAFFRVRSFIRCASHEEKTTQLDAAIAAAEAIFAEDNYAEKYAGIEELKAAYEAAMAVGRELLAEDGQAIVDAAAAALIEALEALEKLKAELVLKDVSENDYYATLEDDYGVSWAPTMGEMAEADYETDEYYGYICGLVFDMYADISDIIGTQGGASYEFEANEMSSGALTTGDKITLDDGRVYYLVLFGDATGDGAATIDDIGVAADMYNWASDYSAANNAYFYGADVVADGSVTIDDIAVIADMYNFAIDPYAIPQDGTYFG